MNIQKFSRSIGGGAVLISIFSILSKILGFYRDRLLASTFGASRITDIYFASFRLPDLIFNMLVLGALTSAFIPVFQRTWLRSQEEAQQLTSTVLNMLLCIVAVVSVFIFLVAPQLIPRIVPGFSANDTHTTVSMTRIMLVTLFFFTASNVLGGVLNAWSRFLSFAISPVLYNCGIIIGIVFLYPAFGIYGLAYGVVIGSIMHFSIQLFEALRSGWIYRLTIKFTRDVRRIVKLMIPRTIGLAATQINVTIMTVLASTLAPGQIAIFTYADNLQSFPIGIFGISLAVASFPSFSQSLADNNTERFRALFSLQFRRVLFFLIPISFTVLLLRAHIVRVILGTGAFDWEATRLTAQALGYFAISLTAQGLIPLMTRAFYASEDTRTPVLLSLVGISVSIILSVLLVRPLGVIGLAIASSTASLFVMTLLFIALKIRFGKLNDHEIVASLRRILIVSLISAALIHLTLNLTDRLIDTHTFIGIFLHGALAGSVGITIYFVLSGLLHFDEFKALMRMLRRIPFIRRFFSHAN